ncbi:GntR family transcriptional regulator [Comamonas testosteroni]|uniref:GntR family transcriptional regulator n=1 Tax=Comamonas testosteroni TaxID=285 RepID=A0A373FJC1_COMTE|nr:GntR family transcriptional regulator [Comamonas testosteroni]RGE44234.1 GntR family transcriptional regulator [Comamonas testosteroni]
MSTPATAQTREKLHLQLERLFRSKIATGEWAVGQSIPTVEELEALHGVSRTTVRMAVRSLVDEGLLETRKRGGTVVMDQPYKPPSFLLPTSWQELVAFGEQIQQITLHQANDCVPPIPTGFPLPGELAPAYMHFLRVHTHGDARFCLSELYLEQELYPRLQQQLERATLAQALGADPSLIATARQHLSVTQADERVAEHLGVPLGAPLMQALRWACGPEGRIVYWAKVRFHSEYVHMEMDLLR